MKRLILLRHGKSSWKDSSLDDHDRPLNARGNAAVPVIGKWLVQSGYRPDIVLCSSSVRTCQTALVLSEAMPRLPDPIVDGELYHAAPGTILARLHQLPDTCGAAMVIGHQPGLGALTRLLADGSEDLRCQRAYDHFPTAGAAVLDIECDDWADLAYQTARFIDFAKPREIIAS